MREIYLTKSNIDTVSGDILKKIESRTGKKRELNFKTDAAALVILDMQNYFLDEESHAFIPSAEAIVPNVNNLIQFAQAKGLPIIVTKHTNNETNARMMNKWWNRMLEPDSELSNISDKIHLPENYNLIEKHQYDAFYETGLSENLEKESIETVIITGVMTNLCVETTARSAFVRGYNTILPVDATASYGYDYHFSSCLNLSYGFSHICKTSEIVYD